MAASSSLHEQFRFNHAGRQQAQQQAADHTGVACPSCNASTQPGADICEACGHWLLEGQCCFCYAPYRTGQKFCGNCGNPPTGITCKQCGTVSHFDFCPSCVIPLSKKAGPSLQVLLNSPEVQQLKSLQQALSQAPTPKGKDQLQQLNEYFNRSEPSQSAGLITPSFNYNSDNKDFSVELNASQALLQELQKQQQVMDDIALKQQIRALQEKVFSDNQAARLYYTSIKLMLPELKTCSSFLGWKCNYANFIHYYGPSDCACPGMGGHWVCKDDVQWTGADSYHYDGLHYTPGTETKGVGSD